MLAAIQTAVNEAVGPAVENAVTAALRTAMQTWERKISELEDKNAALEFKAADLLEENAVLRAKLNQAATTSALKHIDNDMYSRKWNIIVHGIKGPRNESEEETEKKIREMASDILKIDDAKNRSTHPFAACHRLSREADSGVIVKFSNLTSKNIWMAETKKLKGNRISISQDLPPILKPLKSELLGFRKMLNPEQKPKTKLIYSKSWPYLSLKLADGTLHKPRFGLDDLLKRFFDDSTSGSGDSSFFLK